MKITKYLLFFIFVFSTVCSSKEPLSKKINGTGIWSSAVSLVYLPSKEVAATLPKELKLIETFSNKPGLHPVLFMFGLQENVKSNYVNRPFPPYYAPYLEFILAVPGVTAKKEKYIDDVTRPYIYLPLLYLDRWYPVWVGKQFFGYNKILVKMNQKNNNYVASTKKLNEKNKPTILSASWIELENLDLSWKNLSELQEVESYLTQRVISVRGKKVKCFPFSWNLDGAGEVKSIDLRFELGEDFLYDFSQKKFEKVDGENYVSAFYYKKSWRNHLPISCRD